MTHRKWQLTGLDTGSALLSLRLARNHHFPKPSGVGFIQRASGLPVPSDPLTPSDELSTEQLK